MQSKNNSCVREIIALSSLSLFIISLNYLSLSLNDYKEGDNEGEREIITDEENHPCEGKDPMKKIKKISKNHLHKSLSLSYLSPISLLSPYYLSLSLSLSLSLTLLPLLLPPPLSANSLT